MQELNRSGVVCLGQELSQPLKRYREQGLVVGGKNLAIVRTPPVSFSLKFQLLKEIGW